MAVCTSYKQHQGEIRAMLSYARDLRNMARSNYNWLGYDRHFRLDREQSLQLGRRATRPASHIQNRQFSQIRQRHHRHQYKHASHDIHRTQCLRVTASNSIHGDSDVNKGPHVSICINAQHAKHDTLSMKHAHPTETNSKTRTVTGQSQTPSMAPSTSTAREHWMFVWLWPGT